MLFRIAVGLCVLGAANLTRAAQQEQPNVLFIFADDMSYETIGAHGMLDIDTPNLDRLARRGASFLHAYNMGAWTGAVCVCSRAMLNTGRYLWNAKAADIPELIRDNRFWAQRMQRAGYRTYMAGKWHVLSSEPSEVFEVVRNVRPGMPEQTSAGYDRPKDQAGYDAGWKPWERGRGGYWQGGKHWSEVLADDGVEFLQQASGQDQPFFMYLAFNAPHDPRQAPREYVDRYPLERVQTPANWLPEYPHAQAICGKGLRDERLMPYPRTEYAVKVNRQEYFALITHMDDQIGRILDALAASGKAGNTYIVFTADHGLAVGRHGLVGKQNLYDHSVRVPFLVVGPRVQAGATIDTPVYLQDVMPTSLDWAGASPADDGIDFKTLLPLLHNETTEHYDAIYGAYMQRQRMVTSDNWKLIVYPTINTKKLFDLSKDPDEMNDLSANAEYTSQLTRLSALLERQMTSLGDPLAKQSQATAPRD